MLGDDGGALGQGSELAPGEFVDEVAEVVVVLLLAAQILDGDLQLALDLSHEHVVDEHVVVPAVQLILDPHQLEEVSVVILIQTVEGVEQSDEARLAALDL